MRQKQNRKVAVFAIFLSLISIGILVFGFLLVSSNKVIMMQSVSNIYKKISKLDTESANVIDKFASNKRYRINSDINVNINNDNLNVKTAFIENVDDKKASLDLILNTLDKEVFNGNFVFQDNKLYGFIKDITDDYYYTTYKFDKFVSTLSSSDYEKLLDYLKDAVDENISNKEITKEQTTIKYNGKNKKVNKLKYNITDKKIKDMVNAFITSVRNDKKLYKNIADVLNTDTNNLDKEIDDMLNEMIVEDKTILEYNVYYYGFNRIVEYQLKLVDADVTIDYKEEKNNYTFTIKLENMDIFVLNVIKNKNNYSYTGNINSPIPIGEYSSITFNGTYSENDFTIKVDKYEMVVKYDLTQNGNDYVSNYKINIKENEKELMNINANIKYSFGDKVEFDGSKAIDINSITPEDYDLLMEKIENSTIYNMYNDFNNQIEGGIIN